MDGKLLMVYNLICYQWDISFVIPSQSPYQDQKPLILKLVLGYDCIIFVGGIKIVHTYFIPTYSSCECVCLVHNTFYIH